MVFIHPFTLFRTYSHCNTTPYYPLRTHTYPYYPMISTAAVRESRKEGSVELSIGVLAISLGLLDDAARLFREAGRFDYLNRLYQAAGIWDKAVKVSKTNDRIHLKNTHYQFAKHLESIGDIDRAIEVRQ